MPGERILVVEDEEGMREFLKILLGKEGYQVVASDNGEDALRRFKDENFHVVITDIKMPGMDGMQVLTAVKEIDFAIPVIIMTGHASMETAIEAVNKGAFAYLLKQARNDEIKQLVKKAIEVRTLRRENRLLKQQLRKDHRHRPIIGKSEKIRQVFSLVDKVAETDSTILIHGESGTGKELVAREIHCNSSRAKGQFVSINCGALPETLLESELFGHVRGSFTGAVRDKEGLLAVAKGGTFFLDEVGETSPAIQVKLLRVIQFKEFERVGGMETIKTNVRIIVATHKNLEEQIKEGLFREDLYYRINVFPIYMPPLRERKDDIMLLADYFLEKIAKENNKEISRISTPAIEMLTRYHWPGNIRELENCIERAVLLCNDNVIRSEHMPPSLQIIKKDETVAKRSLTEIIENKERELIIDALKKFDGKQRKTAKELGISERILGYKIKKYNIHPKYI